MFIFDFATEIQAWLNIYWWQINFLLLIILATITYLSYKKPLYACLITIIMLPTYLFRSKISLPVQDGGLEIPFTFLELCILITFVGWAAHLLINKRDPNFSIYDRLKPYRTPIILIVIGATLAFFISPDLAAAAGIWKAYFIEPLMLLAVLLSVVKKNKDQEKIIWALGISTLAISLLAICQKFTGFGIAQASWVPAAHRRVTAIFTSPNAVGLYLAPITLIYIAWFFAGLKNLRKSLLKAIIIVLALLAMAFTVSVGTWLGLLGGLIFLSFFAWNKKWTTIVVGLTIVLTMVIPAVRQNIMPILFFQDASGQNRLMLWDMAKDTLLSSPKNFLLGAGIGGFAKIENQLRNPLKLEALLYPHNIFLNFWLELGLVGLIGFVWLIITFFIKGFTDLIIGPKRSILQWGIMAAVVAIVIHGLIDVPYFKNDLAVLFWTIIALL